VLDASRFANSVVVAGGEILGGDWNLVCFGEVEVLGLDDEALELLVVFFSLEVSSTFVAGLTGGSAFFFMSNGFTEDSAATGATGCRGTILACDSTGFSGFSSAIGFAMEVGIGIFTSIIDG